MGQNTWSALFEVIRDLLVESVKSETESEPAQLVYSSRHDGIYPCGESFSIDEKGKDDYKSRENRRVEIVFFDKGKAPELIKPENKKKVKKSEAVIYDKRITEKKPVFSKQVKAEDSETIVLEWVYPQVFDASKPHKQYVNLSSNGKEQGNELTIKVKTKDLKANTAGKNVYWRVTADNKNSKRNSPKTGIMDKAGGKLVEFTAGIANLDTSFEKNEASIVLACGLAGGDRFTVEAGTDGENFTSKFVVENWRRLWYQLTIPENMKKPKLDDLFTSLNNIFIDIVKESEVVIKCEDGPAGSWVDGSDIVKGNGRQLVIGSHNKNYFHSFFKDKNKPLELHFAFCHHQLDATNETVMLTCRPGDTIIKPDGKNVAGIEYEVATQHSDGCMAFPIAIQSGGHPVTSATWSSQAKVGLHTGKSGRIPKNNIIVNYKNFDFCNGKVFIEIPPEATPVLNDGVDINIDIDIDLAVGWYLGESDAKHGNWLLIVGDRKNNAGGEDNKGMCGVMVHELGHSIDMVAKMAIPGVSDVKAEHGRWYEKRGHQGDHCADGISKADYDSGKDLSGGGGTCVMFGEAGPAGPVEYCQRCKLLILAHDLKTVN